MSSPFFTPGRAVAGQLSMPMGTHHTCPTCRNSHVCDVADCSLDLNEPCSQCGATTQHSQRPQETSYIKMLRARLKHHEELEARSPFLETARESSRLAAELRRQIALALAKLDGNNEEQDAEPEPHPEQGRLF